MTVHYIRTLKHSMNNSTENYENGYKQCSEEIWTLIHSLPNIYPEQRQQLANRCKQMWTNRRLVHHPYQRQTMEQKCLQILINDSFPSSASSSSSSSVSSNSLSSSSPKLWKPYM
jgi:hypothetical protein